MTPLGSSTLGDIGKIAQKWEALLLKALPPPGMSAFLLPVSSQPRKAPGSFAALSILRTELAPQEVRLHRALPALVVPFPFILAPHGGHAWALIAGPASTTNFPGQFSMVQPGKRGKPDTHSAQAGS